jgi:dTDP-4-dehydrorhamnose reductase
MKVIVTGSNGQLGSELRELAASETNLEFLFFDRSTLDLSDLSAIEDIFKKYEPAYLVNCAAYTAVDNAEQDHEGAFAINATAVGTMATVCRRHQCRMIHISTDYVFNGKSDHPFFPDDTKGPLNVYGLSKLKGEELALQENPDVIIIRTSWVYSSYGKNFVKTMMRLMKEKESINVVNDQVGSPTYAADLAASIMVILKSGKWHPGIYHYSNEGLISWYDFAIAIKQFTNASCLVNPVDTSAYPTPARRPFYSALNTEKIKQNYPVRTREWKESLRICIGKLNS